MEDQIKLQPQSILRIPKDEITYINLALISNVEQNFLWETLALFIKTNREENTRYSVEYYSFFFFDCFWISWMNNLGRVEGYLY